MSLADELRAASLTADLDDVQRAELIAAGHEVPFVVDDELFVEGQRADVLWILLEGTVELSRRIANRTVVLATMSTPGQWAGGLAAWGDADGVYRATGRATSTGRFLAVPSEALAALVGKWSPFARHMINGVYQTVRSIDTAARERESLVALGTMAAGLAHEINNPASASLRAVEKLRTASEQALASLVSLAEQGISADTFLQIDRLRAEILATSVVDTGAMANADREETIGAWLEQRGVAGAWLLASELAGVGVDGPWLDQLGGVTDPEALPAAVGWITSAVGISTLLGELTDATARIGHLVADVKTYSAMDRAELRRIDVVEGIESTLTMLASKLGDVPVTREHEAGLPEIEAYAAELNQVWTNLIVNAVDAMDGHGTLRVATRREGDDVVVEITDSGPGIDPSLLNRVFEPFFTTKDVGKGTGLGLDISRRIVDRHDGTIEFDSVPGRTTARVRLPISK